MRIALNPPAASPPAGERPVPISLTLTLTTSSALPHKGPTLPPRPSRHPSLPFCTECLAPTSTPHDWWVLCMHVWDP